MYRGAAAVSEVCQNSCFRTVVIEQAVTEQSILKYICVLRGTGYTFLQDKLILNDYVRF